MVLLGGQLGCHVLKCPDFSMAALAMLLRSDDVLLTVSGHFSSGCSSVFFPLSGFDESLGW